MVSARRGGYSRITEIELGECLRGLFRLSAPV